MDSRKIQLVGKRSYSISLPKEWILSNKLKEKERVFIEKNSSNELILSPTTPSESVKGALDVDLNKIENVAEFLVFCYVKNIDRIKFNFEKTDYDKLKAIRKVLNYLEGFDITSEGNNHVEVSFLFKDFNTTTEKLLMRMIYSLRLLVHSLKEKDMKMIEETENSVDRLYHLSKRLLFSGLYNPSMRSQNKITDLYEIFFHKEIFKKIESMADVITKLSTFSLSKKELANVEEFINLIYDMLIKKKSTKDSKIAMSRIKIPGSTGPVTLQLLRMKELCRDIIENYMSVEFNKHYF